MITATLILGSLGWSSMLVALGLVHTGAKLKPSDRFFCFGLCCLGLAALIWFIRGMIAINS